METKNVIIAVTILVIILLLVGVLGKHYSCKNGKCTYNYFDLSSKSKQDCEDTCKLEDSEMSQGMQRQNQRQQRQRQQRQKPHVCVYAKDQDKAKVVCIPTKTQNGREYHPITNELATSQNSYRNRQLCNQQIKNPSTRKCTLYNNIPSNYVNTYWGGYYVQLAILIQDPAVGIVVMEEMETGTGIGIGIGKVWKKMLVKKKLLRKKLLRKKVKAEDFLSLNQI